MSLRNLTVLVRGQAYAWSPDEGLDPAVVATVEGWIRLQAGRLATTAARRGLSREDLHQAGRLGALQAARRFHPGHAANFLTFAKAWIRQALIDCLASTDEVHLARPARRRALKAGTLPTVLSTDMPVGDEQVLLDLLPSAEADPAVCAEEARRTELLRTAMARLEGQERLILALRHMGDLTLEAIGERLTPPVGRERVRQLLLRAESRLRAALRGLGFTPEHPMPPPPLEPPRPPQGKPVGEPAPPTPGTRRWTRAARRTLAQKALGTPLPLDIPA